MNRKPTKVQREIIKLMKAGATLSKSTNPFDFDFVLRGSGVYQVPEIRTLRNMLDKGLLVRGEDTGRLVHLKLPD